jgi:precorrin-2 dehydrogenase/sirohydrochlorin ferrochelatase
MRYYPIFLDLRDKPCVVIGGGQVAQSKVEGLLAADAAVTVVSPALTEHLEALRQEGRINYVAREYQSGDLEGFVITIVATDDRAINAAVTKEGRKRGVWVNAVDDPPNCDFIMPAIIRRGDLTIAVSTGGASPALARKLREELEAYFSEEYISLLDLVAEVRQELRKQNRTVSAEVWNAALTPELRSLLANGKHQEAKDRLLASLYAPAAKEPA